MPKVLPIDDLLDEQPKSKVLPIDDLIEDQAQQVPQSKPMGIGQAAVSALAQAPSKGFTDMMLPGGPILETVNQMKRNVFNIHPEENPEDIGAYTKDFLTDPRNAAYAGAGAIAGLPKGPNIGGFVKSLKPTPFNPMAAEEAVGAFRGRLKSMDPLALRQAGIPEPVISKTQSYKGQYGASELPTTESAGQLFGQAWKDVPQDFKISAKPLKGKLGKELKQSGMIGERGQPIPGVTKDSRQMQGLMDVYSNLKNRVKLNEDIPKFLDQTQGETLSGKRIDPKTGLEFRVVRTDVGNLIPEAKAMINKAIKNPDILDKPLYERTKMGLRALLGADEQANLPVYRTLEALDVAAEKAGVKGLRQAKTAYNIAKETEKAQNIIKGIDTTAEKSMQSLIKRIEDPMDLAARKELTQKIGKEKAGRLIKDADARILREQNIGKIKKATGIGLLFGGAKYGAGKFRDAVQQMKQ